jgi:hypothetical protein
LLERDIAPVERAGTLLSDIASLLWRLQLYGVVESPIDWQAAIKPAMAGLAAPAAGFHAAHIAFVLSSTGDETLFEKLVDGLREEDRRGHPTAGSLVLPLAFGIRAFSRGAYDETIRQIEPLTDTLVALGGSNAQREVFTDTLIQAYMRAGHYAQAEALLDERLRRRDFARDLYWLGQSQAGRGDVNSARESFSRAARRWVNAEQSPEQRGLHAALS